MNMESLSDERTHDIYVFPLSSSQQRLWFLAQWEPDSSLEPLLAYPLSCPQQIEVLEKRHSPKGKRA